MTSTTHTKRSDATMHPEAMTDAEIAEALHEFAERITAIAASLEAHQ